MTDGLAESFNDKKELFDYDRIKQNLQEAVDKSPTKIAHHLRDAGKEWRTGKPQDDDITFVVIKIVK
jgi:serine phosphatase RsbU (regulator of sigma subunit)